MAKDSKGHGSEKRGFTNQVMAALEHELRDYHPKTNSAARAKLSTPKVPAAPVHSAMGVPQKIVYIDKHPHLGGEMKVTVKGGPKSHGYYTDDKDDAVATAYAAHGQNIQIKFRRKEYD